MADFEFTVDDARIYIEQVEWRFAKTMPQFPHWYTMVKWRPELAEGFRNLIVLVHREGTVIPWPKPPRKARYRMSYLFLDGYKYWGMEADPNDTTLINRAKIEDADEEFVGNVVANRKSNVRVLPSLLLLLRRRLA